VDTNGTWWLGRKTKSRWQKSTMLANVTELTGKFETGSLKHSFDAGVELSRETTKNAGYNFSNVSTVACPAGVVDSTGKAIDGDCTPLLNPDPNASWSGNIARGPLNRDIKSTTQAAYFFDTIELNEQ